MKSNGRCALAVTIAAISLSGCAATYVPPQSSAHNSSGAYVGSVSQAMIAARRALVSAGYQITAADDSSGTISTAPRDYRLTPEQADCGTTMGINYLKDNRTTTRVAIGVMIDPRTIAVQSTVQGEYKPGAVSQNITLSCVSKGQIEQDMLQRIKAALL